MSVCLHGTPRLPLGEFLLILYLSVFRKFVKKIQVFLQNWTRITGTLHKDQYTFLIISRSVLLRMRDVSGENYRGNQNTHLTINNFFFPKICRLWDNVEKYSRARQNTDDNMAHAHCMPDT